MCSIFWGLFEVFFRICWWLPSSFLVLVVDCWGGSRVSQCFFKHVSHKNKVQKFGHRNTRLSLRLPCLHTNLCSLHVQEAICRYVFVPDFMKLMNQVTLLAEISYLNPNAVLKENSWRMIQWSKYLPHSKSTCCISKCHVCSILFPVHCHCSSILSLFLMISWVFSAEEYPLGCWEMQQNPIRGESEAGELAAIKDWFPGCLSMKEKEAWRKGACDIRRWKWTKMNELCFGKLCFGGIGSDGKIQGGCFLSMFWWDSRPQRFFMFQLLKKCQVSSLICVFQEKAEAKAYCRCLSRSCCLSWWWLCVFWGDAHENEVVQKNCMKFWDGRTVWPCDHAILETLVLGPLEGEGNIPGVYIQNSLEGEGNILGKLVTCGVIQSYNSWPVRRGRSCSKSVIRYILTDDQQGWNNHLQITSFIWTLAHEMICWLIKLIETSRRWRNLESTTMKTSPILRASCLEREDERSYFCLFV